MFVFISVLQLSTCPAISILSSLSPATQDISVSCHVVTTISQTQAQIFPPNSTLQLGAFLSSQNPETLFCFCDQQFVPKGHSWGTPSTGCPMLSSRKIRLPSKIVLHQRVFPPKVIFYQILSSNKCCLPSKDVFHQSLSSTKGRLP